MTVPQRHITAGDLTPVTVRVESAYGVPTGDPILYGDVAEDGKFTMKDTPNPYLSWRYGSRSFNPADYVTQQKDAAFSATLEVRDVAGWERMIEYATGEGGTVNEPQLPTRTEEISVAVAGGYQGREYRGCKTDKLTIRADAPGGIVTFEEEVLASKSVPTTKVNALSVWTADDSPAVQWMNGMTVGGTEIYPQSFALMVTNDLGRERIYADGEAITGALPEGRRNITFEAEIWMEDLAFINADIDNASVGTIVMTLGIENPVTITMTGCKWMADGTHPDLIQDKQRQTLRFRVSALQITTPTAVIEETPEA